MEISGAPPFRPPRDRRPDALGNFLVLPDELICAVLELLTPRDVARLSCVSSVMYIFCNEEPLCLSICLNTLNGPLQYKGSWKKTVLHLENVPIEGDEAGRKPLTFDEDYTGAIPHWMDFLLTMGMWTGFRVWHLYNLRRHGIRSQDFGVVAVENAEDVGVGVDEGEDNLKGAGLGVDEGEDNPKGAGLGDGPY